MTTSARPPIPNINNSLAPCRCINLNKTLNSVEETEMTADRYRALRIAQI